MTAPTPSPGTEHADFSAAPVIEARDVWKIFGPHPQRLIGRGKRARGGRDPVDIGLDCDRKPVRRYGMQVFARTRTSSRALRAPLNRSARDARRGGSRI